MLWLWQNLPTVQNFLSKTDHLIKFDKNPSSKLVLQSRIVKGPTTSGPNPARTRKYKPEHGLNPKSNLKPPIMPEKKTKVKLGLKNLAMLSSCFDYIFMHLRQKARNPT